MAKSEVGDKKGAVRDFTKEIELNPTNGQAFFERGLENYWKDRNSSCNDIFKGLSLGAKDTSRNLIRDRKGEIFISGKKDALEGNRLIETCKDINNTKLEYNINNYQFEKILNKSFQLLRKYFLVIPVLIGFIYYMFIKYEDKED